MSLPCFNPERMQAFLAGELAPLEEEEAAQHLDRCVSCERLAAELSDDQQARELAAAKVAATPSPTIGPEIDDLRRRLHVLGLFDIAIASSNCPDDSSRPPKEGTARGIDCGEGSTAGDWSAWRLASESEHQNDRPRITQLGPYEIIRTLGSGSFGIVYLAEDRRLRRQVAIKVARASVLTDPVLRIRFFREAEALARLEHPHILPVYEANEIDGLCFLVLAYCDGPTLEEWLRERGQPVEPSFAARLVLTLAQAVEHAHNRGILHRDIKPGNILLPAADKPDPLPVSPKLTDFGLAKAIEETDSGTLAGMVLGTAHYMAPEQAAGHTERIGPHTDVYSLGAILYELLSGRLPIEGNSTIDTLRRLLIDEPIELQHIVKDVPNDLAAIVARCLQKSPAQRYATAAELADDLERFLAGRPTKARPLAPAERLSRWLQRHRALVPLLSLAVTAVGLSLGLFHYADRLSRSQNLVQQANEQLGRAHEQAAARSLYLAQQAYANDMAAAGKSAASGDVSQALEALRRQRPASGRLDLRGLEWHYLFALSTHQPQVYVDAGNQMYQMRLSPDGKELAAVGSRGLLRLYDAERLTLRVVIPTGQVESNGLAYSPSGRLAATAGDDGTIRVFDLATRKERLKIAAHPDKAYGVVFFDGDGKLASCGKEPAIRLWDAATGDALGQLEGHQGQVEQIDLSPNGELLVSAGSDRIALLWNLNDRSVVRPLRGHRAPLMSACFSPDGLHIATGSMDNTVALWDVRSGRRLDSVTELDRIQSVAFSSDSARLYAGDRSGSIHQYRIVGRMPPDRRIRLEPDAGQHAWHAHETRVWCVTAGRDPGSFFTAGQDKLIRRWDRRPLAGVERTIPATLGDTFVDLEFSPDGKLLLALRETSGVAVIDGATLLPKFTLDCRHSQWRSLKLLAGRDEIAAGNAHGVVAIWNYKTGELRRLIAPPGDDFTVHSIAYSPHSGLLAILPYELDEVRVYHPDRAALVARLPTTNHTAVALSPDGRYVAVDSLNNILLFDIEKQQAIHTFAGHTATVYSIAFSPDGNLIASASGDRTVRLWSIGGAPLAPLTGHLADATEVRFSPDGRTLLSVDDRGVVVATHVATRQFLLELPPPADHLRSLAISADSRRLAAIRTIRGIPEVVILGPPPAEESPKISAAPHAPLPKSPR
jgi:WD40 repeat protein/serine/threonine protein kinase